MNKGITAVLGVVLLAAACGGGSDEPAAAAPIVVVENSSGTTTAPAETTTDATDTTGATTSSTTEQTDEELALEFAQCMRDEGVDFADPIVNADGSIELFQLGAGGNGGFDPNDPAVTDAFEVCGELIEGASFLPGAGTDQSELEDNFLEFAQCLRDQGFDVDDPDLSAGFGGGGGPAALFGDNFDITDPANADAVQECQGTFGAGGPFGGGN